MKKETSKMNVIAPNGLKNGIVTLFGVTSSIELYGPTSFVATNQYYQPSSCQGNGSTQNQ